MELVARLKATSSTDASSVDKNSTSMHPSGPQQKVLMVLPAEGVVFCFFLFLWRCCMMPLRALSFSFRIKVMKPGFVTRHDAVNEVVLDIIPF
jgi:hypothetical protein